MIFKENVYLVCVDGLFAGITEDEYEIADVASDFVNGVREPLYDDDMPDRLFWHTININRYIYTNEHNCYDKIEDKYIMCYNDEETKKCMDELNKLNFEKERVEAKVRALLL